MLPHLPKPNHMTMMAHIRDIRVLSQISCQRMFFEVCHLSSCWVLLALGWGLVGSISCASVPSGSDFSTVVVTGGLVGEMGGCRVQDGRPDDHWVVVAV